MRPNNSNCSINLVGEYEAAVLGDERIILPVRVLNQLERNGIERMLVGRLPGHKALILCSEALWGKWLNKIKKKFPFLKTDDGARTFLIPWQPIHWDAKGRVSLPKRARDYAGIRAYGTVIIVGVDYYFELWPEEEFIQMTEECQIALGKSLLPQSAV